MLLKFWQTYLSLLVHLQRIMRDRATYDGALLVGPPGCGKTFLCRNLTGALNRHYKDMSVHVAHSAMIAANIGGATIARALHYGKWLAQPTNAYEGGTEGKVGQIQVASIEETQSAGSHSLTDMAQRWCTGQRQVRFQLQCRVRAVLAQAPQMCECAVW